MGRRSTDEVIEGLVTDAVPVRRLRPPFVRASIWLAAVAGGGILAVFLFSDLNVFVRRADDGVLRLELIGTLLTGVMATIAAYERSLPDRSPRWLLLPLAPLVVWLGASVYSCYRHVLIHGPQGWVIGESASCFVFILEVGIPLGLMLSVLLRRSAPLYPISVAAAGGLAAATVAAFALQFFHPFDVTFMDLGIHLTAISIIVAIMAVAGISKAEFS